MLNKYIITDEAGLLESHQENKVAIAQFKKDGYLLLTPFPDGHGDFEVEKTDMWVSGAEVSKFMKCIDTSVVSEVWIVTEVMIKKGLVTTRVVYTCASENLAEELAKGLNGATAVTKHTIIF